MGTRTIARAGGLVLLASALTAAGSGAARGDIVVDFAQVLTAPDPNFIYTFHAALTNVVNPPGEEIVNGDFFTVYDIPGLIAGTNNQPPNWAASFALVGRTPAGVSPADSTSILNVTWTYVGTVPLLAPQDLGLFSVEATSDTPAKSLVWAGQDTIIGDGKHPSTGTVTVTAVPEPGASLLVAFSVALGAVWCRRRRAAVA
jgi:hypothetical protein